MKRRRSTGCSTDYIAGGGIDMGVEVAQSDCGLSLWLDPTEMVFGMGEKPRIVARLANNGSRTLTLVQPGDGSRMGRRTPTITWSFMPGGVLAGFEGCGNINELKRGEVFVLNPGETRELVDWIAPLVLPAVRSCRAVMVYSNEPDLAFRGALLGPHDERELARLRASDRCQVTSNQVEILLDGDLDGRRIPPLTRP
jgi:hypothetical protein